MSALHPSERVIRRLRAHRLVPERELVTLATAGARLPSGKPAAWVAVHPVTGAAYPVASAFPVGQVAAARQWLLAIRDGVTMVEPADAASSRLTGHARRRGHSGPGPR